MSSLSLLLLFFSSSSFVVIVVAVLRLLLLLLLLLLLSSFFVFLTQPFPRSYQRKRLPCARAGHGREGDQSRPRLRSDLPPPPRPPPTVTPAQGVRYRTLAGVDRVGLAYFNTLSMARVSLRP